MPLTLLSGSFEKQQLLGYVKPGLAQSFLKGRDANAPIVLSVGAEMVLSTYSELLTGTYSPEYQDEYKDALYENLGLIGHFKPGKEFNKPFSAFWKIFFKAEYRGKADFLPSLIKMPVTAVTMVLEFVFKNIGAVFSRPLSYLREKTKNGKSPSWGWFALASIPWLISQPFFLLGNTFAYARRTVNAVCNLVSSGTALIGDGLGWIRDKILKRKPVEFDYGNKYPRFTSSLASAVKNAVLLAANTAVIGVTALTTGLLPPVVTSVIPSVILSGITTVTSTVASLSTTLAITAWAGIGAAVTTVSQSIVSGISNIWKKVADKCSARWGEEALRIREKDRQKASDLKERKRQQVLKQQEENEKNIAIVNTAKSAIKRIEDAKMIPSSDVASTGNILIQIKSPQPIEIKLYKVIVNSYVAPGIKALEYKEPQEEACRELTKVLEELNGCLKNRMKAERKACDEKFAQDKDQKAYEKNVANAESNIYGIEHKTFVAVQLLKPYLPLREQLTQGEKDALVKVVSEWSPNAEQKKQTSILIPDEQISQFGILINVLMLILQGSDDELSKAMIDPNVEKLQTKIDRANAVTSTSIHSLPSVDVDARVGTVTGHPSGTFLDTRNASSLVANSLLTTVIIHNDQNASLASAPPAAPNLSQTQTSE